MVLLVTIILYEIKIKIVYMILEMAILNLRSILIIQSLKKKNLIY